MKKIREIRARAAAKPDAVFGAHFSANIVATSTTTSTNHSGIGERACLKSNEEKLRASGRNGVTTRKVTRFHQKLRGSETAKGTVTTAATAPAFASNIMYCFQENLGSSSAARGTASTEYCLDAKNNPKASGSNRRKLRAQTIVAARVTTTSGSLHPVVSTNNVSGATSRKTAANKPFRLGAR